MDDLTAFALAYALAWTAVGLYLVHLHRLAERVSEEVTALESERKAR